MHPIATHPQKGAPGDPVTHYLAALSDTLQRMPTADIWRATELLYQAWQAERFIYLCGNGGSSATASHMANDLNKLTISPGQKRMKAIALSDNTPLLTAWANDARYEDVFAEQLLNFVRPGDVLVTISASGNSPNVLRAAETARAAGAVTIAFTGANGGRLKDLVDLAILIPDPHLGRQEDGHMILDHLIANILRQWIGGEEACG